MLQAKMFLGLEISHEIEKLLKASDPHVRKAFIKNEEPYLQSLSHEGMHYLGKYTSKETSLAEIELLEQNIVTLLYKIIPQEMFPNLSLRLFPVLENE